MCFRIRPSHHSGMSHVLEFVLVVEVFTISLLSLIVLMMIKNLRFINQCTMLSYNVYNVEF